MSPSDYPLCASENLQIEETGTEIIVFDTVNKRFHFLNATAHTILMACNGTNSIRDIAVMLAGKFDAGDLDSIVADVTEMVSTFQTLGLMMFVADDSPAETTASDATEGSLLAVSVSGLSMFPVLLSGDKVLVKKSALEDLAAGDIVVWSDDEHNRVAHRIVSLDLSSPPLITTKGDFQPEADPPVEFERVLGKIVAVLRDGKVRWISELNEIRENGGAENNAASQSAEKPSYKKMQVLDLRDISPDAIRNIGTVEEISVVLVSPENAHAWSEVSASNVKKVVTVPPDFRVYTGQPELLPEMVEFLDEPLRLLVSGQLFLTTFDSDQITKTFAKLILLGQVYVSSPEAKAALEPLTDVVSGEISVVPADHSRWIGQSILGPEYLHHSQPRPLVVIGDLALSQRLDEFPANVPLFK